MPLLVCPPGLPASACLSVCLLSVSSACLLSCLPAPAALSLHACLSVCLSVPLSCVSVCSSVCLSVSLSVCLSVWLTCVVTWHVSIHMYLLPTLLEHACRSQSHVSHTRATHSRARIDLLCRKTFCCVCTNAWRAFLRRQKPHQT